MPRSERRYCVLDVFTDEPFSGNPLAVVLEGDGLSDAQMQMIAAEFNLSETVFIFPPDNPAHNASLRIFTPKRELPFAGHPTVGTAVLLGMQRFPDVESEMDCVTLMEEKVGLVRARVKVRSDGAGEATFAIPQLSERIDVELGSKDEIAAALGLHIHEIGFENHVPTIYSAGVPYAMVPVKDLGAMERAAPVMASWTAAFAHSGYGDVYLYTRETVRHDSSFHARMFAPDMGVMEDPATGSAAAAFAGTICQFDKPVDGSHQLIIEQGFEMGRASIIHLELEIDEGELKSACIGGHAVLVASGALLT